VYLLIGLAALQLLQSIQLSLVLRAVRRTMRPPPPPPIGRLELEPLEPEPQTWTRRVYESIRPPKRRRRRTLDDGDGGA
jgi:hypothetical protein